MAGKQVDIKRISETKKETADFLEIRRWVYEMEGEGKEIQLSQALLAQFVGGTEVGNAI